MDPLQLLADELETVSCLYAERYGIDRDDNWFVLKLREEVSELTQAFLMRAGQARDKGRSAAELEQAFRCSSWRAASGWIGRASSSASGCPATTAGQSPHPATRKLRRSGWKLGQPGAPGSSQADSNPLQEPAVPAIWSMRPRLGTTLQGDSSFVRGLVTALAPIRVPSPGTAPNLVSPVWR